MRLRRVNNFESVVCLVPPYTDLSPLSVKSQAKRGLQASNQDAAMDDLAMADLSRAGGDCELPAEQGANAGFMHALTEEADKAARAREAAKIRKRKSRC